MTAVTIPNVQPPLWRDILDGVVIGLVLTVLSYFVGIQLDWITNINWLEAFAVATSYCCTWLCVKQRRFNYVVGVVTTIAYVIVFLQADLIASMAVNIYLVPTLMYGWFRWNRDEITKPVKHVEWKWVPVYLLVTGVIYLVALGIVTALGGALPWGDSAILIGTILAQFLLDNKKIETWFIWAFVNVMAIYVYFTADLSLVAFQYVFFLINTVIGYRAWNKDLTKV